MKRRAAGAAVFAVCVSASLFAQNGEADALAEYRKGNYEGAAAICRRELAASPYNADSVVVLCWSLVGLQKYEEAREAALASYGRDRYDGRIVEVLGEINFYQGNNSEALRYFQDYINRVPNGVRIDSAYAFVGEINIRLGRFRHADIAWTTALHYQPLNAQWLCRLAYAKERLGETQAAVASYEKALSQNENLSDARIGLARSRAALAQND